MNRTQQLYIRVLTVLFFFLCSCGHTDTPKTAVTTSTADKEAAYLSILLGYDTLTQLQRNHLDDSIATLFYQIPDTSNPYYFLFKSNELATKKKNDSALYYLNRIMPGPKQHDLALLKDYKILKIQVNAEGVPGSDVLVRILDAIKKGESNNNRFTYMLYDLLAQSYYESHNSEKVKFYTNLYNQHHPFRSHKVIQQRHYDISFLMALREKDTASMRQSLDSSRALALKLNDSTALIRTLEAQAQLESLTGQLAKSVATYKAFFLYHQRHGTIKSGHFNNIAVSFEHNGQYDSAIAYFKKGIAWVSKYEPKADLSYLYNGLRNAYANSGDYKNAYMALDSTFTSYQRNTAKIKAEKTEEIHTHYETEKKDRAIAALQTTNVLHEKIIDQQRWLFAIIGLLFLATVLFVYNTYRRKLLSAKNERLQIENKRLLLEQKVRQMQLNPHFIYNSIANLQGLIIDEKKQEANAYLLSFSKLMRNTLELNREEFITLNDEINSLKNYLALQKMRYDHAFEYEIENKNIETSAVLIPPMLVQPFVENAIEHGFKNISYKGKLYIDFIKNDTQLQIKINDNGMGLAAEKNTAHKKSLSGIITQERLDILFNHQERQAYFETTALEKDQGFVVNIYIPYLTA